MPLFGKNRMFKAIHNNEIATAKKLLDGGYYIYAQTEITGTNAPMLAVIEDRREILDLFFQRGLDFTHSYPHWGGKKIIHIACEHGRTEIVEKILKLDVWHKSLPGLIDYEQENALHVAARHGHKAIFELLLQAGFDPYCKNGSGKTAVGIAHEAGHVEIVSLVQGLPALPAPKLPLAEEPQTAPKDTSGWILLSPERVACVSTDEAIEHRLTDMFNFLMRERVSFSTNTQTGFETRERIPFDDHTDKTPLECAHDAYAALGGKIAKDVIYSTGLGKPMRVVKQL